MSREIERWITMGGRRIPVFKKSAERAKKIKKPEGNPELTLYGKYKNERIKRIDSDYPSKEAYRKDMKANEITNIHIADKRDEYISKHTNFGNMSQIYNEYKNQKMVARDLGSKLAEKRASELKQIIDKANKIYLQKTKKYKMKK